jgi:tetratricopeptide (TPR) repeat protein
MKQRVIFLTVSLVLSLIRGTAQDLEQTRIFADGLYASGNFTQSLAAYQRVLFFNDKVTDASLLLRIADNFLACGDKERAIEYFDHAYYAQSDDSLKVEVLFKKAGCYLRNQDYNYALIELLSLNADPTRWYFRKLNFYLGMAWFGQENFKESEAAFLNAARSDEERVAIRSVFGNKKLMSQPNPKVASWLSIFIPGSGQVYTGYILDGINSFLLTGSFVALSFYLAVVTTPLDAILTALPWFERYYQGGFQRAEELADKKRSENRSIAFDRILTLLMPTGI